MLKLETSEFEFENGSNVLKSDLEGMASEKWLKVLLVAFGDSEGSAH